MIQCLISSFLFATLFVPMPALAKNVTPCKEGEFKVGNECQELCPDGMVWASDNSCRGEDDERLFVLWKDPHTNVQWLFGLYTDVVHESNKQFYWDAKGLCERWLKGGMVPKTQDFLAISKLYSRIQKDTKAENLAKLYWTSSVYSKTRVELAPHFTAKFPEAFAEVFDLERRARDEDVRIMLNKKETKDGVNHIACKK